MMKELGLFGMTLDRDAQVYARALCVSRINASRLPRRVAQLANFAAGTRCEQCSARDGSFQARLISIKNVWLVSDNMICKRCRLRNGAYQR